MYYHGPRHDPRTRQYPAKSLSLSIPRLFMLYVVMGIFYSNEDHSLLLFGLQEEVQLSIVYRAYRLSLRGEEAAVWATSGIIESH